MIGFLDPENIARNAATFTPAASRFVLELCIERGVKLDGDTVLLLREIAKRDRPDWEAKTADQIVRENLESRGISLPKPRVEVSEKSALELVESREDDTIPVDESEEKEL